MGLKTGVWEDKTKPMENEKWINDGQKTGDVERRAPPEQGEATTSAEVVTILLHWTLCKLETSCPESAFIVDGDFNKGEKK